MLKHELRRNEGLLILTPTGKLEASDFNNLARHVDLYLEENGFLQGLMIHTQTFPGWAHFSALVSHLRFVRDHHKAIRKVAAVSDSLILTVLPTLTGHFVSAEVKHFDYAEKQAALEWLAS